ncbi:ead/Ea22-like family protein [Pseudomonas helleri]|uniref:ead/Ea22-like family protein n=1 Tax=Pseudomonas helleri TaxID=1608996 RepID=UPI003FD33B4E
MNSQNAAQKLAVELTALAKAATPGPWTIDGDYINEYGHVLHSYITNGRKGGGRIASTFVNCLVKTNEQCRANAAFIAKANPAAILALIAENERLSAEEQEAADLCDRLSGLLRSTAIEVRGPEDPLKRHGFHDLPSRVKVVVAGRDQLKAFAAEMISASFEGGSFDGGDIQDIAVKHGLLRIERREDECGEGCACREYGFPAECYRKTPILDTNAENSAPLFTINDNVAQDREEKNV